MKNKFYLSTLVFLFLGVHSCYNNPLDIDVSAVELNLEVKSFEKDLFLKAGNLSNDEIEKEVFKKTTFF